MFHLKVLVMFVLALFLLMPTSIKAELHSDTIIGNGEVYVDLQRYITRGDVLLPLFYTSRQDLYGYPLYVICELKEVYYKDVIDMYKDLYDFKEITIYDDLRIAIYETYFPYDVKDAYNEVKNLEVHSYCEVALVTQDEKMGWPLVVEIPDETTPIGNKLFWWTKW